MKKLNFVLIALVLIMVIMLGTSCIKLEKEEGNTTSKKTKMNEQEVWEEVKDELEIIIDLYSQWFEETAKVKKSDGLIVGEKTIAGFPFKVLTAGKATPDQNYYNAYDGDDFRFFTQEIEDEMEAEGSCFIVINSFNFNNSYKYDTQIVTKSYEYEANYHMTGGVSTTLQMYDPEAGKLFAPKGIFNISLTFGEYYEDKKSLLVTIEAVDANFVYKEYLKLTQFVYDDVSYDTDLLKDKVLDLLLESKE